MREKKVLNSYLNQRAIQDNNEGVQTETLAPATVKISSSLATFANPYSIITNEYVETKTVTVSYVINPAELAKNEVKLPQAAASEVVTTEAPVAEKVKEKEYPLPEVPVTQASTKMSDMEILNRLSQYQDAPVQTPETKFEIPKDAEIFDTPKEETASNDLEILKLFPDSTHVYGWTRCVEAGAPADLDLEMYVDENVPTVFYAQAFCAKSQLAKYLADKYNGLYIDIDDYASNSIRAKIEAFLRLS